MGKKYYLIKLILKTPFPTIQYVLIM